MEKEFQKKVPELMNALGISNEKIKDCINIINDENKVRDKLIEELKNKYNIYVEKQDFPVVVYGISVDDFNKIYINHDCSRWIHIYYNDHFSKQCFDPLEQDCLNKICEYIDEIIKNINIKI